MAVDKKTKKYQREATKQLLVDILKAGSGMTILLSRPSGSLNKPSYFFQVDTFDMVRFRRTVRYAKKRGYVEVQERGGEMKLNLSEKGHTKALRYSIEDIHIEKPLVWDKKWRMVMFDVPENMRLARNVFKAKLDRMGFAQLQKSLYVHPYPCHNEIEYIRSLYNMSEYIKLAVIDKLEGDDDLRKRFGL